MIAVPNGFCEGLAREPLPLSDLADAGSHRSATASRSSSSSVPRARPTHERFRRPRARPVSPGRARRTDAWSGAARGASTYLNQRYTFANFIVGSANRLAHAASLSVAERPGHAYQPAFPVRRSGVGKTHLMHAIAMPFESASLSAQSASVYATSEKVHQRVASPAFSRGKIDEFRARLPGRIDLSPDRRHPVSSAEQRAGPRRSSPHLQHDPRRPASRSCSSCPIGPRRRS